MKKTVFVLFFLGLLSFGISKERKDAIPPAPNPPRLVNDFVGVMTSAEQEAMERRLVAFNDSTSNVVCVVIVSDLGNYSPAQFAYEIGDRWGVRSKEKRNGVVILVKPNRYQGSGDGEVYISVGYDLEGAIPDAIAKRIIEQKMIPELKQAHYQAAIDSALSYIIPLALGEISAAEIEEKEDLGVIILSLLFIITPIVVLVIVMKRGHKGHGSNHRSGGGSVFMGPTSFGGYRGNFGGGFGGFGGSGGFGGGGAGGRF